MRGEKEAQLPELEHRRRKKTKGKDPRKADRYYQSIRVFATSLKVSGEK